MYMLLCITMGFLRIGGKFLGCVHVQYVSLPFLPSQALHPQLARERQVLELSGVWLPCVGEGREAQPPAGERHQTPRHHERARGGKVLATDRCSMPSR